MNISIKTTKNLAIGLLIIGLIILVEFLLKLCYEGYLNEDNKMDMATIGQVGDFIGGVVGTIWSVAGILLIYATFEQQNIVINREIEKEKNENILIRNVILDDLKENILKEMIAIKNEYELYIVSYEDGKYLKTFRNCSKFSSDVLNSITIQKVYEAFEDKNEFRKIIHIYKEVDFLKDYVLINLFKPALLDYKNEIPTVKIHDSNVEMIKNMPEIMGDLIKVAQSL
jgi:hypothetical protein